jgi:hypothetical protein
MLKEICTAISAMFVRFCKEAQGMRENGAPTSAFIATQMAFEHTELNWKHPKGMNEAACDLGHGEDAPYAFISEYMAIGMEQDVNPHNIGALSASDAYQADRLHILRSLHMRCDHQNVLQRQPGWIIQGSGGCPTCCVDATRLSTKKRKLE